MFIAYYMHGWSNESVIHAFVSATFRNAKCWKLKQQIWFHRSAIQSIQLPIFVVVILISQITDAEMRNADQQPTEQIIKQKTADSSA